MGKEFFKQEESDQVTNDYEEIEGELLDNSENKDNHDRGSEEFWKNSKRKSKIQKVIDKSKQNYNDERELKRQTEPVEDWKNSIEAEENTGGEDYSFETETEKYEIENFSVLLQEFIDEMEKGGKISNGKIMFIKSEIEKNNINENNVENYHFQKRLSELYEQGKLDEKEQNEKNSIIIKLVEHQELEAKVEQVSEFIIKNDQKAKQSRESEAEQQAVIETEGTEEVEEGQETETEELTEPTIEPIEDSTNPTGEQGTELAGVPESYRGIIDTLKETNRMVNEKIASLSPEVRDLVEELGLGGDLSAENLEKAKNVMKVRNLEKATALDVSNAKIASSHYVEAHLEVMQLLDETSKRIEAQGSSLMNGILDLQAKEKQRVLLGTQVAVAVDNFAGAVRNTRRQQSETQEGENHRQVSTRESLDGIDNNVVENINKMDSKRSINETHNIITKYLGASESETKKAEIEFKKDILNDIKSKEYRKVKESCNESIREVRENGSLSEEKSRAIIVFYEKIIRMVDEEEAKEKQGIIGRSKNWILGSRTKIGSGGRESRAEEDLGPNRMRTVDESIVSLDRSEPTSDDLNETTEETSEPDERATEDVIFVPEDSEHIDNESIEISPAEETPETPEVVNPDAKEISNQTKGKIKEKLREAKGMNIDQFQAISGLKNSIELEKTVDENCNRNPFFKKLIVDSLVTSMSENEKDEICEMKTKDLFDLYDEVKSE